MGQVSNCVRIQPTSSMQECMDTYGIEGSGEWLNNSISRDAEFWSCGMIARKGVTPAHDHDGTELKLCQTLAAEAARVMGKVWACQRSGAEPENHPFFVTVWRNAAL
jgi:hypothetical protein